MTKKRVLLMLGEVGFPNPEETFNEFKWSKLGMTAQEALNAGKSKELVAAIEDLDSSNYL